MENPHRPNTKEYYDFKRDEEREKTLYRVASVEFWIPYRGSCTVVALWPKGETAEQIANRFLDEADRKYGPNAMFIHRDTVTVRYAPPLASVFALVEGRTGN